MTTPIDRTDLQALIKHHRDTLWSHRWQMSSAAESNLKNTIQALEHYRDLCDTIDSRPPDPDPYQEEPALPAEPTAITQETP